MEVIKKIKSIDFDNVTNDLVNEIANEIAVLCDKDKKKVIIFMIDDSPISGFQKKLSFYSTLFRHNLISDFCDSVRKEIIEDNSDFYNPNGYLTKTDLTDVIQKRITELKKGKTKFIKESDEGVVFTAYDVNYWTNTVDLIIDELKGINKNI